MTSSRAVRVLLALTFIGLVGGGAAALADRPVVADALWGAIAALALAAIVLETARALVRGQFGVDVIAILAIVGAFLLGELLTAAVIALMLTSGRALEQYAASRAERELSALLQRAPRTANRRQGDEVRTVPAGEVRPGDRLLVCDADVVPVDGVVVGTGAVLDESALTGESHPVHRLPGDRLARVR